LTERADELAEEIEERQKLVSELLAQDETELDDEPEAEQEV
jgi:hypothetical protein